MATTPYSPDKLTDALRAAAEAFLASLNGPTPIVPAAAQNGPAGPIAYDPLNDAPPFTPNPVPGAPEAQQQIAWITYLGAIGRINAEKGRGATSQEVSEFAKKAGYSGGNAVNGWNSRPGSPRAIENQDGARWLNDETLEWIGELATKLGIELEGEYDSVPKPS
jgi:hypothetical protein